MYCMIIKPIEFRDLRTGEIDTGLLICDDYVSLYITDERFRNIPKDNIQLIKMIIDYMMESTTIDNNHLWGMFHDVVEYGGDLYVSDSKVDWDIVADLVEALPKEKPVYGWLNQLFYGKKNIQH